jgi:hypothetical protein
LAAEIAQSENGMAENKTRPSKEDNNLGLSLKRNETVKIGGTVIATAI